MESFKVIEKETKTKAFSKQGLEAARERKDPKEQARDEAREGAKGKMAKDTYNQIKSQIKSKSNLQV